MDLDLLPPLSSEEFAALEADIKANGVLHAVFVDEDGNILDGRHRLKIDPNAPRKVIKGLSPGEKEAFVFRCNFARRNLSVDQKDEADKRMKETAKKLRDEGKTQTAIGQLLGVSQGTVSKWFATNIPGNKGVKRRQKPKCRSKLNKAAKKQIVSQVSKGKSQDQAGADFGVSQQTVSRIITAAAKEAEKAREQEERIERAKALAMADGVHLGDFREVAKGIPDGSVDLIFTDPPYHREYLPLYDALGEVAQAKLAEGGSLITYLGQYQIDEVLKRLGANLRLWWTLAVIHSGDSARMREYGVVVKWKPLLWFVKGTRGDKNTFVDDLVDSRQEKDAHDWQQSVEEASYYIEKLTKPGAMVFDPFCGGGTTAVACRDLGRKFITCDVDNKAIVLANERIHAA